MGRSESDVIEVALVRMCREEIRYNRVLRKGTQPEDQNRTDNINEGENEIYRNDS